MAAALDPLALLFFGRWELDSFPSACPHFSVDVVRDIHFYGKIDQCELLFVDGCSSSSQEVELGEVVLPWVAVIDVVRFKRLVCDWAVFMAAGCPRGSFCV